MRAGARRRRTHESRQCVARRISCNITSWRAAKNWQAKRPAHTRPPGGGASGNALALRSVPAARWRSATPPALRMTWARPPTGRRVIQPEEPLVPRVHDRADAVTLRKDREDNLLGPGQARGSPQGPHDCGL